MKQWPVHPCAGCVHFGVNDEGYGPYERHENYCFRRREWNPNGCDKPLERGCASWVRECNEQWGPVLDRHGVQLVVCGHEHWHRWDENTGYRWKQVLGGGPELGYGAGFVPSDKHYPTIIEGAVEDGRLVVRTHDAWRGRVVDVREFARR